jgi:dCTP deaminase
MILNDKTIKALAKDGMIEPFVPEQIRKAYQYETGIRPLLSYGLSSFGYDIRLSPNEFKIFRHVPGTVINPKRFNPKNLESTHLYSTDDGDYFILPAHSYGLGVAVEKLVMPDNVTAICMGKSTYARCGVIANITPVETGWSGHLTLEFSNSSGADCRLYANEGVVQLLFLQGDTCDVTYEDRKGKYQYQDEKVTLARV